jgi:hypothetical protein
LGMEMCGKINASNSVGKSWMPIGVVAAFCARALMVPWPGVKIVDATLLNQFLPKTTTA